MLIHRSMVSAMTKRLLCLVEDGSEGSGRCEEDEGRAVIARGKHGVEVLEDVQLHAAGLAGVEIPCGRPTSGRSCPARSAPASRYSGLEIIDMRLRGSRRRPPTKFTSKKRQE
jgi:hypothetical protein